MVAESLVADRDLDLANNYANNDGVRFGAEGLTADVHARPNRAGALWSVHDIGLPLLIAPVYAAATRAAALLPAGPLARFRQSPGHFAYSIISITLIAFCAFGGSLLHRGLSRVTSTDRATAVVLALFLSPPVLAHTFLVFPEVPALVVVCAVVWLICLDTEALSVSRVTWIVGALGAMPWLHRKYSFLVFALLFVILRRHLGWFSSQRRGVLAGWAALFILPQVALHAWTFAAWGNIGGPQMLGGAPFTLAGFWTGSIGLLVDRERGLAGFAPIYLIAPAALALTWRRNWDLIVPWLSLYLPMSAFADWSGGYSPAARYLVPLLPLTALPCAEALSVPIVRRAAIALVAFQALITASVWQHPRNLWPHALGTNLALETIPVIGPLYEHALPDLSTSGSLIRGWICMLVLAALTTVIVRVSHARGEPVRK
jgi:hypothetical protein